MFEVRFANASDVYGYTDHTYTIEKAKRSMKDLVMAYCTSYDLYSAKAEIWMWNINIRAFEPYLIVKGNKTRLRYINVF